MYMAEFVERMKGIRICPVLVIEDKNDAIPLGKALLEGKLPVAEVTFRTAAAKESIALNGKGISGFICGCGNGDYPAAV
jgi:4-hydroxy-2-oxoglutarate aldolase